MYVRTLLCNALAVLISLAVAACGAGTVPVEGTVTLDGQPLERALLSFFPEPAPPKGSGVRIGNATTDKAGHFILSTHNSQGVFPGHYKVTVSKREYPPGVNPGDPSSMAAMMNVDLTKLKELVPVAYTNPETTHLRLEVSPDGNRELMIELSTNAK